MIYFSRPSDPSQLTKIVVLSMNRPSVLHHQCRSGPTFVDQNRYSYDNPWYEILLQLWLFPNFLVSCPTTTIPETSLDEQPGMIWLGSYFSHVSGGCFLTLQLVALTIANTMFPPVWHSTFTQRIQLRTWRMTPGLDPGTQHLWTILPTRYSHIIANEPPFLLFIKPLIRLYIFLYPRL